MTRVYRKTVIKATAAEKVAIFPIYEYWQRFQCRACIKHQVYGNGLHTLCIFMLQ